MARAALLVALALVSAAALASPSAAATTLYGLTQNDDLVGFNVERPHVATIPPFAMLGPLWKGHAPFVGAVRIPEPYVRFETYDTAGMRCEAPTEAGGAMCGFRGTPFRGSAFGMASVVHGPYQSILTVSVSNAGQVLQPESQYDQTAVSTPPGPPPSLIAAAFDSTARLFAVDDKRDALMRSSSGWSPTFSTVGPLGIDVVPPAAMTIVSGDVAYLAASTADGASRLYRVDLATGAATVIGPIVDGHRYKAMFPVGPPRVGMAGTLNAMPVEEGANVSLPLLRSGDPEPELVYEVRTIRDPRGSASSSDHAEPGVDYESAVHTVRFAPGQRTADVPLDLPDDDVVEPDERFAFVVEGKSPASQPAYQVIPVHIYDNDAEFAQPDVVGVEGGEALVTVTRPDARPIAGTIDYSTGGGTATPGTDFVPTTGTLRFAAGEASKTFTVKVLADGVAEPAETVQLSLHPPAGVRAVSTRLSATLAITDPPPLSRLGSAVPRLALRGLPRRSRLGSPLRVTLACTAACRVSLELRLPARLARRRGVPAVLARTTASRTKAGTFRRTLRLSPRSVRRLRRAAPVRATLVARLRPSAGRPRTARVLLVR